MSVDLRRFVYGLEPLLRQRQWQLESSRALLGSLQRRITATEGDIAERRTEQLAQGDHVARLPGQRLDAFAHVRYLHWLRESSSLIAALEVRLTSLRAERSALLAQCKAQQQKVEAIENHRTQRIDDFVREERARIATEADRDWLARDVRVRELRP